MSDAHRAKNYLITGSTGIAAETARRAAKAGARVFVVSIDESSARSLREEIETAGGKCEYAVADLTIEREVVRAAEKAAHGARRIDALFNVAGISGRSYGDGALHECTVAGWEKTIDANAKTAFLMCRETLKIMLAQTPDADDTRGAILNVGSVLGGIAPEPKFFATHAYAASKAAIEGLSCSMAAFYAPHKIRVNVIAPCLVKTPMSARAQGNAEIVEFMREKCPLGEAMLDAADIAEAALFLLGANARRITGQTLVVDGGWSVS